MYGLCSSIKAVQFCGHPEELVTTLGSQQGVLLNLQMLKQGHMGFDLHYRLNANEVRVYNANPAVGWQFAPFWRE